MSEATDTPSQQAPANSGNEQPQVLVEPKPATPEPTVTPGDDFSTQSEEAQPSLVAEFLDFLVHNKAWWLTPIIIVLLLVGLLVIFGGTAAAPFIYTIF